MLPVFSAIAWLYISARLKSRLQASWEIRGATVDQDVEDTTIAGVLGLPATAPDTITTQRRDSPKILK
jgi:hypothetical protein